MKKKFGFRVAAVLMLVLLPGMVACASQAEVVAVNPLYQADFEEAYAKANDFQREILQDGNITDAEYLEMQDRLVQCMADLGYEAVPLGIGEGYRVSYESGKEPQTSYLECEDKTSAIIEDLFSSLRDNPKKNQHV